MARITTIGCERSVPNRFELVLLAAERAHELWKGAEPHITSGNDKPTVLALREIANGRLDLHRLRIGCANRLLGIDPADEIRIAMPVDALAAAYSAAADGGRPPSATEARGVCQSG